MAKIKKPSGSARERGHRIRRLREALRYSRQAFSNKHKDIGISARTLENWEEPRWHGVTEEGAEKLISAFSKEGLHVTLEWIFFEKGEDPLANFKALGEIYSADNFSNPSIIAKELKFFHELHSNIVDAVITDDELEPFLQRGDYVAGRRLSGVAMEKAIGLLSIVQTTQGQLVVRIVEKGINKDTYTLCGLKPHSKASESVLENISLQSVAPVIWMRKSLKL